MGELIHIRAVGAVFAPPDAQAHYQPLACPAIEGRVAHVFPAVIEDAHGIAVSNATGCSVIGVHFQHRAPFDMAQRFDVDEGGVQKVAGRGGDHLQRVLLCGRFVVGQVVGQRLHAQLLQTGAVEFTFA